VFCVATLGGDRMGDDTRNAIGLPDAVGMIRAILRIAIEFVMNA
jgi:hypothetical protein